MLSWSVIVFGTTLAAGSFLMFQLEPIVARLVLPLLGGAPMVWNACLLFFQTALLAGYACAHGVRRLAPRWQTAAYMGLLLLACFSLPVTIGGSPLRAGDSPAGWLLGSLTTSIGLPFLALAVCAPMLQSWFAARDHRAAHDPYFLYAASNAGSLLALVSYPALVEPLMTLGAQRRAWTAGFLAFGALAGVCAAATWRLELGSLARRTPKTGSPAAIHLSWAQRSQWVALAAVPSSLLLAVTNYLSTDIAAVPLLWIAPLSLYLLTFIVAFGVRSSQWADMAAKRLPLPLTALVMFMAGGVGGPLWLVIPVHLLTFALAALACHGRLANERPPADRLTEYYFWLAFGGMLGGLFNTFLAPLLFSTTAEYPLALLAAMLLAARGAAAPRTAGSRTGDSGFPLLVAAVTAVLVYGLAAAGTLEQFLMPALGVPAILAFSQAARPLRFALSLAAILIATSLTWNKYGDVLYTERTFFGTYRVTVNAAQGTRALYHGTTLHGVEAYEGPDRGEPLTYYQRLGPFGQAYRALPAMSSASEVAVIGLGVGSLAAYAGPGQYWTFFEIDPAVERIARTPEYFTHLGACGARCRVVLGDARLSLARETAGRYGLLVLDAFSSDAIPVHLLTREAIALYLDRLSPGGVLAFHISNRHLALAPVVARLADDAGLAGVEQEQSADPEGIRRGRSGSHWVVMAREAAALDPLRGDPRWRRLDGQPAEALWTDDFSNILGVLKF